MEEYDIKTGDIKTGDIILIRDPSIGTIISTTSTGGDYSHIGIAIRYVNNKISLNNDGTLYILHMNGYKNKDAITNENSYIRHTLFSRLMNSKNVSLIAYRKIKDIYRTEQFVELIGNFYNNYKNYTYQNYYKIIYMVFDIKDDSSSVTKKLACNEFVSHFYLKCLDTDNLKHLNESEKLQYMFGDNSPLSANLYTPVKFTAKSSPNSQIFDGPEIVIYDQMTNFTIQSSILLLVIILIIICIGYAITKIEKFNFFVPKIQIINNMYS
jgi:hypothetical protein